MDVIYETHTIQFFMKFQEFRKVDSIWSCINASVYFGLNLKWMRALFIRASKYINHWHQTRLWLFTNVEILTFVSSSGLFLPSSELRPENDGGDNLRGNFEKIVVVTLYWTGPSLSPLISSTASLSTPILRKGWYYNREEEVVQESLQRWRLAQQEKF